MAKNKKIVKPTVITIGEMKFTVGKNDKGIGFKVTNSLGASTIFPTRPAALNHIRSIQV